jgi:hypothetical protein
MNHKQLNSLTKHATARRGLVGAGIGGALGATAGAIYGGFRKKEEDESRLASILKGIAGGGMAGAGIGGLAGYAMGGGGAPVEPPAEPPAATPAAGPSPQPTLSDTEMEALLASLDEGLNAKVDSNDWDKLRRADQRLGLEDWKKAIRDIPDDMPARWDTYPMKRWPAETPREYLQLRRLDLTNRHMPPGDTALRDVVGGTNSKEWEAMGAPEYRNFRRRARMLDIVRENAGPFHTSSTPTNP